MKFWQFIFILFLLTFSSVACSNEKNDLTNNNNDISKPEVENVTAGLPEYSSVIERPLEEEFSDLREIIAIIERYFAFINNYENSDPNDTEAGVLAVLDIISANQYDIDTSLPTMIGYFTLARVENYPLTNMKKLNDSIYLVKRGKIVREEFTLGEVNYNELDFNPYVFRQDGKFKIALAKDRIPEDLYDNFDYLEENYLTRNLKCSVVC